MDIYSPKLFIEINNSEYIFSVGDENEQDNFKLIYNYIVPIQGIENNSIVDFNLVLNIIKKNIYTIEQKLNYTFKETILIINNFDCSFISLSGFKKLNGSQILKENITYIINSLKSSIDKSEEKKIILHIFNSKYSLDKKKIVNLPIGLFGDFYSHELSFCLINDNDHKNLNSIFNKCNVKIKKILLKSFVEGSYTINQNTDLENFYQIKIYNNNSQLFYFENDSLKFQQNFSFGSDLVIKDISKVTSLKINIIKNIITNINLNQNISKDELIEKKMFENENYIKIKKRLLLEIAEARIEEFFEKMISKNINLLSFNKKSKIIFLTINDSSHFKCFENSYSILFSKIVNLTFKFSKNAPIEDFISRANSLAHYGWRKEAIPVVKIKKSIIAKLFDIIFS
jgi:cell division protein FtsA